MSVRHIGGGLRLLKSPSQYNYKHPRHLKARADAFKRSDGQCQFCGKAAAVEGHHWAWPKYPMEDVITGDDMIALCNVCHEVATTLRRFKGDIFRMAASVRHAVEKEYAGPRVSSKLVAKTQNRLPDKMRTRKGAD